MTKMKGKRFEGSIEKRSENSWRMRVTVGYNEKGHPIRKSKTTKTKNGRQREKELIRFINELENENYFYNNAKFTFRSFAEQEWCPKYAEKQYSYDTLATHWNRLEKRVFPVIGNRPLDKITTLEIVNLINNLQKPGQREQKGRKEPLSPQTIKHIYNAMKSVFNAAAAWSVIKSSPCENVPLPKIKKNLELNYYDTGEIETLFKALESEPLRYQIMISIALVTGCRAGELAAIELKKINFDESYIEFSQVIIEKKGEGAVLRDSTKTGSVGKVSVPAWLLSKIEELRGVLFEGKNEWKGHTFLFQDISGKPIRTDSIGQWWNRFTKRHGLRHIRFHDLRHTSATFLINQGYNIKVVQERLRHKKYTTTADIYSHLLEETDVKASNEFKNPF